MEKPLHSLLILLRRLSVTLLFLSLSLIVGYGQNESGQISGRVRDSNDAVIAGASINVKSLDTGIVRVATSDNEGYYLISSLQSGVYEITISFQGFAPKTQKVRVTIGSNRNVDSQLSVTAVTGRQDVVEGSSGVDVNARNFQLADLISGRQIRELPTITRDPYDLISLSGNVTASNNTAAVNPQRDPAYAINGQRPTANNVLLDGGENVINYTSSLGQRIPLDSIQEIQVITSGFRPEFGRSGGGIINVATRQGSNDINGSVYWFHRNRSLSSNSFENNALGVRKGSLTGNQFGYAIGGRLIPDKLFFFNSTEGNLIRSRENRVALVPTAALLAASAPATGAFFGAFPLSTPINGRIFSVADVLALTGTPTGGGAFAALPSALPAFGQVFYNTPTDTGAGAPQDTISTVGRLDYVFSERKLLYGRYAFEDRDFYPGTFSNSPYAGFNTGTREQNHNALLNWTQGIATAWTMNAKGSYNRINLRRQFESTISTPSLFLSGFPGANIGGFSTVAPGAFPNDVTANSLYSGPINLSQISLDFAGPWRNQQFRLGASYYYWQDNRSLGSYQNGVYTLGASLPAALNNLILGRASTFITPINSFGAGPGGVLGVPATAPSFDRSLSAHDFSTYFSHIYRATPRFQVNWGLRYDYFDAPRMRNGDILRNYLLGPGSDVFRQVASGALTQTAGGTSGSSLFRRDWNNIAPRIGVAWDITGDGKTALRGGYSVSYDRLFNSVSSFYQNTLGFSLASFTAGVGTTGILPLSTGSFGPIAGPPGIIPLPSTLVRAIDSRIKTPMVHNWSLSLDREIFPNTIVALQYVGAAGRDLFTISNINRPGSAAAFLGSTVPLARLNPVIGPISFLSNNGVSNYNAVIAEITNRAWRNVGLQFTARYRYGKALDNIASGLGGSFGAVGGASTTGALSPFDPDADYGPSDFDARHRFIGSFNWEVPFGKIGDRYFGTGRIARQVFGAWQLTGIFEAQSGSPFTVFNCAGALTAETPCPRAQFASNGGEIDGDLTPDPRVPNRYNYLDGGNFVTSGVTPGTVFPPFAAGASGRNRFRGPNNWNIDAGIHKGFRFTEDTSIQLRGEFFNIFNNANLFVPSGVDIGSIGYVPAFKSGRRQIQVGVKVLF